MDRECPRTPPRTPKRQRQRHHVQMGYSPSNTLSPAYAVHLPDRPAPSKRCKGIGGTQRLLSPEELRCKIKSPAGFIETESLLASRSPKTVLIAAEQRTSPIQRSGTCSSSGKASRALFSLGSSEDDPNCSGSMHERPSRRRKGRNEHFESDSRTKRRSQTSYPENAHELANSNLLRLLEEEHPIQEKRSTAKDENDSLGAILLDIRNHAKRISSCQNGTVQDIGCANAHVPGGQDPICPDRMTEASSKPS